MKVKTYSVIERAVEDGVNYGWNRAHKYTDSPTEDELKQQMMMAVMHEICEWVEFDGYTEATTD